MARPHPAENRAVDASTWAEARPVMPKGSAPRPAPHRPARVKRRLVSSVRYDASGAALVEGDAGEEAHDALAEVIRTGRDQPRGRARARLRGAAARLEALGGRGRRPSSPPTQPLPAQLLAGGSPVRGAVRGAAAPPLRRPRHAAPSGTCTCGIYGAPFELIRRTLAIDERPASVASLRDRHGFPLGRRARVRAGVARGAGVSQSPVRASRPLGCGERAVGLRDYGVPVDLLETSTIAEALDDVAELAA